MYSLSFTLSKFYTENLNVEKRCAELFSKLQRLQSGHEGLIFENCTFKITDKHLKTEITKLYENIPELK